MIDTLSLFKLLADDTRLSIILLVKAQHELCVCELTFVLGLSQPKISRHLAMLREAGLLVTRRSGKWVHYSLSAELDNNQQQILTAAAQAMNKHIDFLINKLNHMGDRPAREAVCCD